jgi:hypothetical protein
MKEQIEKQLIPRLKFVGCILLLFAIVAFQYERISSVISQTLFLVEEEIVLEFEELPSLNTTAVAITFVTVGTLCLFVSSKAKRRLAKSTVENKNEPPPT